MLTCQINNGYLKALVFFKLAGNKIQTIPIYLAGNLLIYRMWSNVVVNDHICPQKVKQFALSYSVPEKILLFDIDDFLYRQKLKPLLVAHNYFYNLFRENFLWLLYFIIHINVRYETILLDL